jgi:galacturonosyltransferase
VPKRNRILIVETDINNAISGFRAGLVKSLLEKQFEVFVVGTLAYTSSFSNEVKEYPSDLKVYDIGALGRNPFYYLLYLSRLLIKVIKINPSVCLTFNIRPVSLFGLLNTFLRKPCIATITGTSTYAGENGINAFFGFFFRVAFSAYNIYVFQNQFDKLVLGRFLRKDADVFIVNGSGVDTDFYSSEKNKTSSEIGLKLDFLFVGRLIRQKGILEYIAAAKSIKLKNPEICFGILGPFYNNSKGDNAISPEEIAQSEHEGYIKYLGFTNDVKKFMLASKCIVLPTYGEGMSNTLLEACSLEIPVLASDVPGCKEIISHGETGFLFEPRNARSLIDTIEIFLSLDEEEKKLMGIRGRAKIVAEFDKRLIVKSYIEAIESLQVS